MGRRAFKFSVAGDLDPGPPASGLGIPTASTTVTVHRTGRSRSPNGQASAVGWLSAAPARRRAGVARLLTRLGACSSGWHSAAPWPVQGHWHSLKRRRQTESLSLAGTRGPVRDHRSVSLGPLALRPGRAASVTLPGTGPKPRAGSRPRPAWAPLGRNRAAEPVAPLPHRGRAGPDLGPWPLRLRLGLLLGR